MKASSLEFDYGSHPPVRRLVDLIGYVAESIGLSFDRYGEELVKGPGLYFAVVSGRSVSRFADAMGANTWPVENCRQITDDLDTFYDTAQEVALSKDGAVVVGVDGVVMRQMVRFRDLEEVGPDRTAEYDDWMGSRHMSAVDTSLRPEVVAAVTLSEETGRVTLFEDGEYTSYERNEIGGSWRTA